MGVKATQVWNPDGLKGNVTFASDTAQPGTYAAVDTDLKNMMARTQGYDSLDRLDTVSYGSGTAPQAAWKYTFDAAGRRSTIKHTVYSTTNVPPLGWRYDYNKRGEVTTAQRVKMTAATTTSDVAGQRWKYEFDAIGNRTRAETGLTSKPMVTRYTPATGDATQYATVQHPVTTVTSGQESVSAVWGQVFRTGSSGPTAQPDTAPATVMLEGGTDVTDTTVRTTGEPGSFRREFALGSETQAQRRKLTVTAADASSQSRTQTRWVDIPPQTEPLTYDEDGNLTQDARWTYVWDAENRLIEMRENPGMPWFAPSATGAPRALKLVMEYDAYSRRVGKKVYQWQGPPTTGSWQPQSHTVYLYDGWNLVAELDGLNARSVVRTYVWGADLSGSKQGAGGVGGLLLVRSHFRADDGSQSGTRYQVHSDANGNVMSLLAMDGVNAKRVVGRFDYDAFGNRITNTLPPELGDVCPVGFSSKFTDKETGHVYYGFRYYSPEMGRWLNRDPIAEKGGLNLYGLVGNDAVNLIDILGLCTRKRGVGHHLIPYALFSNCPEKSLACSTLQAVDAVLNAPGYKDHNRKAYNNVSETEYRTEVLKLVGGKDICCMNANELKDLINKVKKAGGKISDYNKGVQDEINKGQGKGGGNGGGNGGGTGGGSVPQTSNPPRWVMPPSRPYTNQQGSPPAITPAEGALALGAGIAGAIMVAQPETAPFIGPVLAPALGF